MSTVRHESQRGYTLGGTLKRITGACLPAIQYMNSKRKLIVLRTVRHMSTFPDRPRVLETVGLRWSVYYGCWVWEPGHYAP